MRKTLRLLSTRNSFNFLDEGNYVLLCWQGVSTSIRRLYAIAYYFLSRCLLCLVSSKDGWHRSLYQCIIISPFLEELGESQSNCSRFRAIGPVSAGMLIIIIIAITITLTPLPMRHQHISDYRQSFCYTAIF